MSTTEAPARERVTLDRPEVRCPDGSTTPKPVAAARARHRELIAAFRGAAAEHADARAELHRIGQARIADQRQAALDGAEVPDRTAELAAAREAEDKAYVRLVGARDAVLAHKREFGALIRENRDTWGESNGKAIAEGTDKLLDQLADLRVTLADLASAHKTATYLAADPEYAQNPATPLASALASGKVEVRPGYAPESIDAVLSAIEQAYAGAAR